MDIVLEETGEFAPQSRDDPLIDDEYIEIYLKNGEKQRRDSALNQLTP
ncbi:hypothetical protein [Bifidobacterium canis]|nr:hypothetical protein [Bifidobacterium canis]